MPEPAKCRQWLEKNFPDIFAKMTVGECHLRFEGFNFLNIHMLHSEYLGSKERAWKYRLKKSIYVLMFLY